MSSSVHALSFGSYVKNDRLVLRNGESGEFKILFFSRDEIPVNFEISLKKSPSDFIINYPKVFDSSSYEGEYVLINSEYVKASTITVSVFVPMDVEEGSYEILLNALTSSSDSQQNSLGVNTEKTFRLEVIVSNGF